MILQIDRVWAVHYAVELNKGNEAAKNGTRVAR